MSTNYADNTLPVKAYGLALCHVLSRQIVLNNAIKEILVEELNQRVSRGVRSPHSDAEQGSRWTRTLLDSADGDDEKLREVTHMGRDAFLELTRQLKGLDGVQQMGPRKRPIVRDSEHRGTMTAEEKVLIFLYICTQGVGFRHMAQMVHHSLQTISSVFHEVLNALTTSEVLQAYLRLPLAEYNKRAPENRPEVRPFFEGCVGACDGIHIPISVPAGKQEVWQNRFGYTSHHVLAFCDFEMNFVYILAGMEGSATKSRVLTFALQKFKDLFSGLIKDGSYFLGDVGFSPGIPPVLAPYYKFRYPRPEEFDKFEPQNSEELFNLRHAQLRIVVERTFVVFKRRFPIFDKPRGGFSIRTQVRLFFALSVVHNFINKFGPADLEVSLQDLAQGEQQSCYLDRERTWYDGMDKDHHPLVNKRDKMAEDMWRDMWGEYQKGQTGQVQS